MNNAHGHNRRFTRLIVLVLATMVAVLAIDGPASAIPPTGPDGPAPPGSDTFEPPGPDDAPVAPGLRIRRPDLGPDDDHGLLARSFDVTIVDRSDTERGTRLERRSDDGSWVTATSRSVLSGNYVHKDRDLAPDTRYCYRAVAHNFAGQAASPVLCAVTRAETPQPVARVQLQVKTADIGGAGTRDKRTSVSLAPGNSTWLDIPGDDFGRGTRSHYDLLPTGIADMTDIEHLRLAGGADDPWCVDMVSLLVNGREVFREDFDSQPDGCRWFRRGSRTTVLKVPHRTLRDHPAWSYRRPGGVTFAQGEDGKEVRIRIDARELESRLESLIGHAIHGEDARWRGDGVVLSRSPIRGDQVHVKTRLEETWTPTRAGLDVDVDFDLFFAVSQDEPGSEIRLTVEPRNLDASLSRWVTWAGRVFDALPQPCGAIFSTVTGDGIPSCFAAVERSLQRQIQSGVGGVGLSTTISGDPSCCTFLRVEVDQSGGVTMIGGLDLSGTSAGGLDAPAGQVDRPATTALTSPAEARPERDATRSAPATTTMVVPPRTGRLGPGMQGSWR